MNGYVVEGLVSVYMGVGEVGGCDGIGAELRGKEVKKDENAEA